MHFCVCQMVQRHYLSFVSSEAAPVGVEFTCLIICILWHMLDEVTTLLLQTLCIFSNMCLQVFCTYWLCYLQNIASPKHCRPRCGYIVEVMSLLLFFIILLCLFQNYPLSYPHSPRSHLPTTIHTPDPMLCALSVWLALAPITPGHMGD